MTSLTFVSGLSADEIVTRLGGSDPVDIAGVHRLESAAELIPYRPDAEQDGIVHADRITGLVFIAAADLDGWTMIVEPNGFLCTLDPVIRLLSAPGEMVSSYVDENTDPRFFLARDGEIVVDFDPTSAGWRSGTHPNLIAHVLDDLGFDLSTEEIDPSDPRWHYDEQWQQRVLALMHHVTGIRVTADLLGAAAFRCAAVPDPSGWAWVTADPANLAPYTPEQIVSDVRQRLAAYAADPDAD